MNRRSQVLARGASRLLPTLATLTALAAFTPLQAQTAPPAQTPAQTPARTPAGTAARPPAGAPAGAAAAQRQGPAQPPAAGPGEIRGTVLEREGGLPVASASVAVWSRGADSALVAGAIANANGNFRIEGLRPGSYSLRVNMMGFSTVTTAPLSITAAAPRVNAGQVRLARSSVLLAGVTATGERQAAVIAPDRNSYTTRAVAPAATNASEVLENVPSVQVDADGKVSLRGNENVVIQINGRPSPIRGAQLSAYLRQLPANTLDRVEVIPNPSARQDPEGMAGIINIVLKQNVDLGLSGGASLGASTSERYTASGNLGYQQGPATIFASYGLVKDNRAEIGVNDRTRLGPSDAPLSFTNQNIDADNGGLGHNFNSSIDYRLGSHDVVSGGILLNKRNGDVSSLSGYSELDGSETLLDQYERIRANDTDSRMVDFTLGYKRTLTPQRHEWSSELRLNRVRDLDATNLWRQPTGGGSQVDAELDRTNALTWQITGQTDYTRMLGERTKLETGYRGYARWLDRDYSVFTDPTGSGSFTRSANSNALQLDETVNAVYTVLSGSNGPFELQAGLRGEYATRDFTLANSGENFPHNYASLFPSGLVSLKLGEHDNLKASYSRRIRRPGTQELNPFPVFFDLQNVFKGDPQLSPEYTNSMELGYQHSARIGSLQLTPFYRRTSNVIRFIINTADTVQGREVTSVSFQNLDHGTSWGADLNGNARFGQLFSGFAALNVFKLVTEGGGGEQSLSSSAVSWTGRVNGTFNLTPNTAFTAAFFYRGPTNIERGRFEGMSQANFSVRQKLNGDKSVLTIRVADPFNTTRFRVTASDDNIIQLTERRFNSRAVFVNYQYTFGRPPRVRQRPPEPTPPPSSPFGG